MQFLNRNIFCYDTRLQLRKSRRDKLLFSLVYYSKSYGLIQFAIFTNFKSQMFFFPDSGVVDNSFKNSSNNCN